MEEQKRFCKVCSKELIARKHARGMCMNCYNRWLRETNPEYNLNCLKISANNRKRYANDKAYRDKVKRDNKKYKQTHYTTKHKPLGLYGDCPVCGDTGCFRIDYKYNNKLKTKTDLGLGVTHVKYEKGKVIYSKHCYVSVKKFPEYKYLLDNIRKEIGKAKKNKINDTP